MRRISGSGLPSRGSSGQSASQPRLNVSAPSRRPFSKRTNNNKTSGACEARQSVRCGLNELARLAAADRARGDDIRSASTRSLSAAGVARAWSGTDSGEECSRVARRERESRAPASLRRQQDRQSAQSGNHAGRVRDGNSMLSTVKTLSHDWTAGKPLDLQHPRGTRRDKRRPSCGDSVASASWAWI